VVSRITGSRRVTALIAADGYVLSASENSLISQERSVLREEGEEFMSHVRSKFDPRVYEPLWSGRVDLEEPAVCTEAGQLCGQA
jgi:hypothetical protein